MKSSLQGHKMHGIYRIIGDPLPFTELLRNCEDKDLPSM